MTMIIGGGLFLWKAAFITGDTNPDKAIIVGFVIGTFLSVPIGFYFGGQDRRKETKKDDEVQK